VTGKVQKEIVRIQKFVAEEFEDCAVIGVAPGLGDHTDVGTRVASISCIVKSRLDLKLMDAIGVRERNSAAG